MNGIIQNKHFLPPIPYSLVESRKKNKSLKYGLCETSHGTVKERLGNSFSSI